MSLYFAIPLFLFSCFILFRAGSRAVKALSRIAKCLQISEFFAAFAIMALACSLPELFVAITSALQDKTALSFGNIMGSNVVDLSLALALPILLGKQLIVKGAFLKKTIWFAVLASALPLLLLWDGAGFSRQDGAIMLLASAFFFVYVFKQKKYYSRVFQGVFNGLKSPFEGGVFFRELLLFFLSAILLLLASEGIILSAGALALGLNINLIFVGLLIVSLGTALPETIFGIRAMKSEHSSMIIGNLVGAIIFHNTFILGAMFLISPLKPINVAPFAMGAVFSLLLPIIFFFFSKTNNTISKKEALVLLGLYIGFVVLQFFFL